MRTFAAIILLSIASAGAYPIPAIVGTYSNLTYSEGEGDVIGIEITILPAGTPGNYSYYALVQTADGEAAAPQLAPIKFDGMNISFSFNYPGAGDVKFAGSVAGTTLIGYLTGGQFSSTKYTLPRKVGFWQPTSAKK